MLSRVKIYYSKILSIHEFFPLFINHKHSEFFEHPQLFFFCSGLRSDQAPTTALQLWRDVPPTCLRVEAKGPVDQCLLSLIEWLKIANGVDSKISSTDSTASFREINDIWV
jgi:hypothetical protein